MGPEELGDQDTFGGEDVGAISHTGGSHGRLCNRDATVKRETSTPIHSLPFGLLLCMSWLSLLLFFTFVCMISRIYV